MEENERQLSSETQRWLEARRRPGNWIDISETDEIPDDITGWHLSVLHMFQVRFAPEIRARISTGQIEEDFVLNAAQLLQLEEGAIVRLNGEVRGELLLRANRPIRKGDPIFTSDLENLVGFDLEEDELNAGHFTIFWHESGWQLVFDFRSGRSTASEWLSVASQFLDASKHSADSGLARPSVDTLFIACELLTSSCP